MLYFIVKLRETWVVLSVIALSAFVELTIGRLGNVVSDLRQAYVCLVALLFSGFFLHLGREACVSIHDAAKGIEDNYVECSVGDLRSTAYTCIVCGILLLLLGVLGWAAWVRYAP